MRLLGNHHTPAATQPTNYVFLFAIIINICCRLALRSAASKRDFPRQQFGSAFPLNQLPALLSPIPPVLLPSFLALFFSLLLTQTYTYTHSDYVVVTLALHQNLNIVGCRPVPNFLSRLKLC